MKVLVVDDSPKHLAAAEDLKPDHEVITTDSYEEAIRLLHEEQFDAVLTDMLMPAEAVTLGSQGLAFLGHEMPIGFVIAIAAVQHADPRLVLMATDINHHNHPMSAALDWIQKDLVTMDGTLVQFRHASLRADGAKDWRAMLDDLIAIDPMPRE